jgi:hypothetical protein
MEKHGTPAAGFSVFFDVMVAFFRFLTCTVLAAISKMITFAKKKS